MQETVVVYDKVLTYRRANQTLAAYFRMGYVFELYAKAFWRLRVRRKCDGSGGRSLRPI